MCLALNMAKMAKSGFLRTRTEETQYLFTQAWANVSGEKKRGIEFPGHEKVRAAMERHPAMIHQNYMDGSLPCQNGTVSNPQTCWRYKSTGSPPPVQLRHRTPDPTPSPLGTPPAPPGPIQGIQRSQTNNLPATNADPLVPHLNTQPVNFDALTEESMNYKHFDPKLLTDKRRSCTWYTIYCV
jgi:hypothetical protein